jgi:hypothetical protein
VAVLEIGALHGRYVRIADRFKAMWTFHQFVAGVFKNFLNEPLPYNFDFQAVYERIKKAGNSINVAQAASANEALEASQIELDKASQMLLAADDKIGPSVLRRFFEKLKKQDETIVFSLVKFYLYSDAVEGDRRDKLDFLLTRIGEEFIEDRGEYTARVTQELRDKVIALVSIMRRADPPEEEIARVIRAIRSMRDEVVHAVDFDDLTDKSLLRNSRVFKHRVGDLYFHPDVLLSIVELNVTTKNRFAKLYESEEKRIVDDAQKLMQHGDSITSSFGDANPALLDEIAKFRSHKEKFDASRAESNIKHDVIAQLKASMGSILAQLDRGLTSDEEVELLDAPEIPEAYVDEAEHYQLIADRFGKEEPLLRFLIRIASAIDPAGRGHHPEEIVNFPAVRELRLETWEVAAYQKLFNGMEPEAAEDSDELWTTYLRAAALRIKIDEEATILSTAAGAGAEPGRDLLDRAKASLDFAKELDEQFGDLLREAVYYSVPRILRQLYRSRFRLLRGFSGLWLIHDQQV